MIFIDTETALIEQGLLAPPLTCLQFSDGAGVGVAVQDVDDIYSLLRFILGSSQIIGHNIAYDMLVLMREYPGLTGQIVQAYREDRVNDTLIREKLRLIKSGRLDHVKSLSLESLGQRYGIEKDGSDPWRLRYGELRGRPFMDWPEAAQEYARHDIEATRHVYLAQGPELNDERQQARYAFAVHCVGAAGVFTDPEAVQNFGQEIQRQYDEDKTLLQSWSLVRPDGSKDTKAAKKLMACDLGTEVLLTKTGQVSLSEEACEKSGHPTLLAYQRYGSHKSLLSRMAALELGYDKPLNSQFDSLKKTGRTSCTKGRYGYQIQNMRRIPGERECFVPRHGNVFLASDYDIFELCALAQCCIWLFGESRLGAAINEGLDPHLLMAAQILGDSYKSLQKVLANPEHPRIKEVKLARQGAKAANFGYPGGMGARRFVSHATGYGMDLSLTQAEQLKADWLYTWPEMREYFDWISKHQWTQITGKDGPYDVTTVQQFRSNRVRGGVTYTAACNSYFQGLAADAAKDALFELIAECEEGALEGWKVWNFVHDEALLEGPEESGHLAAEVVKSIMEDTAQTWIPDVKISATPHMMRRWHKDAEPVYADGKLVPWEPR